MDVRKHIPPIASCACCLGSMRISIGSMKILHKILLVLFFSLGARTEARTLALVGGRLIDGFGGPPLADSVILIDGERITKIGVVGALAVPNDAEVISTEGMD